MFDVSLMSQIFSFSHHLAIEGLDEDLKRSTSHSVLQPMGVLQNSYNGAELYSILPHCFFIENKVERNLFRQVCLQFQTGVFEKCQT